MLLTGVCWSEVGMIVTGRSRVSRLSCARFFPLELWSFSSLWSMMFTSFCIYLVWLSFGYFGAGSSLFILFRSCATSTWSTLEYFLVNFVRLCLSLGLGGGDLYGCGRLTSLDIYLLVTFVYRLSKRGNYRLGHGSNIGFLCILSVLGTFLFLTLTCSLITMAGYASFLI